MKFHSFKKLLFRAFLSAIFILLTAGGFWLWAFHNLPNVDFLSDRDVSIELKVPDWQGSHYTFTLGPQNPDWVPLQQIPIDLQNAVLSGEDFSFYSHKGIDWFELRESLLKDLRERRLARGASTITQQLAKNLFLSREKTVRRKVKEVILARRMEKALTKERILELYLNVVELGDKVYGVGAGSWHHFRKRPSGMTLRQCAFLAAMLPGPKVYDPNRNLDRAMNRSDHLLGVMLKGRMITDDQYLAALVEVPFSVKPSDVVTLEHGPESEKKTLPEMQGGSVMNEDMLLSTTDTLTEDMLLTTQDGIVEIPIKTK